MSNRIAALVLVVVACADQRPDPAEPPALPMGPAYHVAPHGTMPPDTRPTALTHPPNELRRLAAAANSLAEQGRSDHAGVVRALHALANALALVGGDPMRAQIERRRAVHAAAERLAGSHVKSSVHADLVRAALDHARIVLANGSPRDRWVLSRYVDAVAMYGDAVRSIDPDRPLLEQHDRVVAAIEAAVSALEIAVGVSVEPSS